MYIVNQPRFFALIILTVSLVLLIRNDFHADPVLAQELTSTHCTKAPGTALNKSFEQDASSNVKYADLQQVVNCSSMQISSA